MSQWIEVKPAYGRDYTTAKAAKADWNANKDFQDVVSGRYISKEYADANDYKVIIRFSKLMKVTSASK